MAERAVRGHAARRVRRVLVDRRGLGWRRPGAVRSGERRPRRPHRVAAGQGPAGDVDRLGRAGPDRGGHGRGRPGPTPPPGRAAHGPRGGGDRDGPGGGRQREVRGGGRHGLGRLHPRVHLGATPARCSPTCPRRGRRFRRCSATARTAAPPRPSRTPCGRSRTPSRTASCSDWSVATPQRSSATAARRASAHARRSRRSASTRWPPSTCATACTRPPDCACPRR